MNTSEGGTVYTFTVKYAPSAADTVSNKIDEVAKHLASQDAPTVSSVGGEWTVLGLARAGKSQTKLQTVTIRMQLSMLKKRVLQSFTILNQQTIQE